MVWFQCEDCGDNLKKPKLPNHFRTCSASKLSCIDCGQIFGQESVQAHTQCVTEAEKYGPKGQGKGLNGTTPSSNKDNGKQANIDINVGLSGRPPWFCSLCNTKATSKQTLLLHADGKKHRAKARAFLSARDQSKKPEEALIDPKNPENASRIEVPENVHNEESNARGDPKADNVHKDLKTENGTLSSKKKRKLNASEDDISGRETKRHNLGVTDIQLENDDEKNAKEKIKWKKLITSTLKSNPDGAMKIKKLKKVVFKALRESGVTEEENKLSDLFDQKINSSSRFTVEKKYVRLVAKS